MRREAWWGLVHRDWGPVYRHRASLDPAIWAVKVCRVAGSLLLGDLAP